MAMRALSAKHGYGFGDAATDKDRALVVFRAHDLDGNGKLQLSELGPVLEDLGMDQSDLQAYMKIWDKDASGDVCCIMMSYVVVE